MSLLYPYAVIGQDGGYNALPNTDLKNKVTRRILWDKQLDVAVGVFGLRTVKETDVFAIRHFNSNGIDYFKNEQIEVTNKNLILSLFTANIQYHKNFPLFSLFKIPFHIEGGIDLFVQKNISPSAANNSFSYDSDYYTHHYNIPFIVNNQGHLSIWVNEMVSIGTSLWHCYYSVSTSDSRLNQRNYSLSRIGVAPEGRVWLPLERLGMPRWYARIGVAGYNLVRSDTDYKAFRSELFLVRLSQERSGRTFGFFARSHNMFSVPVCDNCAFNEYEIYSDDMFVVGVSFGTGGLNRRGGR